MLVKRVFDETQLGILGEDAELKVVGDDVAPLLGGAENLLVERDGGLGGLDVPECLARGDEDGGLDHNDVVAAQREVDRGEDVADACGIDGLVADEDGAVGPQRGGVGFEPVVIDAEGEHAVEHREHEGRIGRAAAEPCARRDVLVEPHLHGGKVVLLLQQTIGFRHQIVVGVSFKRVAQQMEDAVGGRVAVWPRNDLQRVAQGDGEEHGVEVVVAVGAAAGDLETEVYLGVREQYHDRNVFLAANIRFFHNSSYGCANNVDK